MNDEGNDGHANFPEYQNVYIEPCAYEANKKTGVFPDGTIFYKELQLTLSGENPDGSRTGPSGRGEFPGAATASREGCSGRSETCAARLLCHKYTTRLFAEFLAVALVGGIGLAVDTTGMSLILFPEIAALSHDVFTRPRGKWASQPIRLIATPTITAILGVMITRHWEYGALAVTVVALLSLFVIKLLRSNVGAALSAGVLPMALGVMSWGYPAAILAGLAVLAIALTLWKRLDPHSYLSEGSKESRIIKTAEIPPRDRFWIFALTAFVFGLGAVAQATGLRFLLFPPLIVVAYELFGHSDLPGWMSRPVLFPLVCFLTASVGLLSSTGFHTEFLGVTATMLCSIAILRMFKVHMPPALAVGLIPFVIDHPTFWYPISVSLGAAALIASTRAYSFIAR